MANNQNVNKVVYAGTTLIDLTGDDVTAASVLSGKKFHLPSGAAATGTMPNIGAISGILKGDGAGNVSAATAGTDYATPAQVNAKYTKPSGGIPDTDIASASTWNAKASSSTALSLTLASGSWSSATPPTQTLTATGVTSSNHIVVGIASTITSAQYDAAAAAKLVCTAQGTNSSTVTAFGDTPTENIPISVVILG